jgi:uncharacterized protein (TIGR04255 family)
MLKQYLRLGGGSHAIKEATLSLFFGSQFVNLDELRKLVSTNLADVFNQVRDLRPMEVEVSGKISQPEVVTSSAQVLDVIGFQAAQKTDNVLTKILQFNNDPERVALSLHNLQYNRWADFLALFERVTLIFANSLADLQVLGVSLHYVDELEWTDASQQLPVSKIYKQNPDYFPGLFFKNSLGEVTLTAVQEVKGLSFFDRLHTTSAANGRPVVSISHNVVHQFEQAITLTSLIKQPNHLSHVLQQAHEHNKAVLGEILQPEVQEFIGLIPTSTQTNHAISS